MNQRQQLIKWYWQGGLFFVIGSWVLSPFVVGEKVVAQNSTSSDILQGGIQSQQLISQAMDDMWTDILTSGVWDAMVWFGSFVGVLLTVIWVVQVTKSSLNNELSLEYFSSFLWLFLVLILLVNDGALLRDSVLGIRGLINFTNEQVLEVQIGSLSLEESFNNIIQTNTLDNWRQQKLSECAKESDPQKRQDCEDQVDAELKEYENQIQQQNPGFSVNPVQWAKDSIGDAFQKTLEVMLFGVGIAFQWLVEITLLLTALIAPLAVAGSLLPLQQKPLFTWLLGFYSVGLCKLFYNIIVGLVAHLLTNSTPSGNPSGGTILMAIAVGILSPILAVGLAAGGGMTTFLSLGSLMAAAGVQGVGAAAKGVTAVAKAAPAIGRGIYSAAEKVQGAANFGSSSSGRPRYSSSSGGGKSSQRPPPPRLQSAAGSVSVMSSNSPNPPARRIRPIY
jgi:hypothetical protein